MPREAHEAAAICQHPDEAGQQAKIRQRIDLPFHAFFLIEKPPAAAKLHLPDAPPVLGLLFDCISRTLFLQDRFHEEVDNIRNALPPGVPLAGCLSLGEIADAGNTCLEFFNKTIVLGVLTQAENKA